MEKKNKIKGAEGIQRENASARSEAELRYSAVFDQSPDGILIIDAEGKIVDFNKAAHTDLGYSREEFAKLSIPDIDPLESPEEIRAHIQRTMGEKKAEFEVTHRTKSGSLRNVLIITQTIILSDRTVLHTIWRDITEQKTADKKIRYLASILEHVPDAVCSIDTEGKIVSWNEGAERILGYKADETIGRPIQSIIPEEKVREEMAHCIGALNKEGVFTGHETVRVAKDGRRVPVEISGLALRDGQKIMGYASIMRDITERKKTEDALREANSRLETLIQAMPDMVILKDVEGRYVVVNDAVEECTGRKQKEFIGKTNNELLPPNIAEMCNISDAEAIRAGRPTHADEQSFDKEGRVQFLDTIKAPIHDSKGHLRGLLCVARDITERKQTEEALKESEAKFMELFKNAADAIFIADIDSGIIVEANQAASRLI